MLKRYFIPLILVLMVAALLVYLFDGSDKKPRDIRLAVPVERFLLNNGLEVVVMPNDRLPIVSHLLVVKAGAADDPIGKTGLAHYLEHLMFTGTKAYPEGVFDRSIARVGGVQNAFTTDDYTLYYATVPKEYLPLVMTMEADRLTNLTFDAAHAARERKVVEEERNMRTDTNPLSQLREQLDALSFVNHPYHHPVIGWAEDIATFSPVDAEAFFTRHYRASNMILVIAGDVSTRDVRRFAQRYYGGLSAGEPPLRTWPKEPPQRLARRGEMTDARVMEPRLLRNYIAPSVKDGATEHALPLSVFAYYLGGGDASLLYTTLVREQKLATSVFASYDPMAIGPSLFRIEAIPAPGISLTQLEAALDQTLARTISAPPDLAAITRAKTQLKAEVIFAQDGLQSLATVMAELFATGLNEHYFYQWSEAIEGVTPTTIQAAAKAVLVKERQITGTLLPAEKPTPTTEVAHD